MAIGPLWSYAILCCPVVICFCIFARIMSLAMCFNRENILLHFCTNCEKTKLRKKCPKSFCDVINSIPNIPLNIYNNLARVFLEVHCDVLWVSLNWSGLESTFSILKKYFVRIIIKMTIFLSYFSVFHSDVSERM